MMIIMIRRWMMQPGFLAGLLVLLLTVLTASGGLAQQATPTVMDPVDVVREVEPAVVTVINEQRVSSPMGGDSEAAQPAGAGTGFVIDNEGHIVTNWHVVDGGDAFSVLFADGEDQPATLVGSDEISDLAVVKVDGDVPGVVPFADSSALLPGQTVLAIGSPLGAFTNTVTEGIVSALGRDFPTEPGTTSVYTNLIQHDAAINPGNSGGPLFDLTGAVVGVNTLGIPFTERGPVQGLFFAIPSNTARQIAAQLIDEGEVNYPFLGIVPVPVTGEVVARLDLSVEEGVLVQSVEPDSPADEAGFQENDVLLELNGTAIDRENSLAEVLFAFDPGVTVEATVQRGDEELTLSVTLAERE
jgi:2-alkenal reductase